MPELNVSLDDLERGVRAGYSLSGDAALAVITEIRRLHVAIGQQTDQVRRKTNRCSTLDHRLRDARTARDAAVTEVARLTAALEAIDDFSDCAALSYEGQCFEVWPSDPGEWCGSCTAHIALIPPAASS